MPSLGQCTNSTHLKAQLAAGCRLSPQQVSHTDVHQSKLLDDACRLGALAGSWGTGNDDFERAQRAHCRVRVFLARLKEAQPKLQ